MSIIKLKYDTALSINILLASLADNNSIVSNEIDNSLNLYEDYLVRFSIKTGAAGVSSTGKIFFYAVGAIDDTGRTYPSNNKGLLALGLPMDAIVNATTYVSNVYSIRKSFNGILPNYFKIVVDNQTGSALDATEANHNKRAQGIWRQVV